MKYIVDMPDDWKEYECPSCLIFHHALGCHFKRCILEKMNAKKAGDADLNRIVVTHTHGAGSRMANPRIDGKPIKLYAVEE